MDMLTLAQLADKTELSAAEVRAYRDVYVMFIPTVRVGQLIGYPPDAVDVLCQIHRLTVSGLEPAEVNAELERQYPVTVITAQPLGAGEAGFSPLPVMTGLLREVGDRFGQVHDDLAQLRDDLAKSATEERALQIQASVSGIASTTAAQLAPLTSVPGELGQIRQAISLLANRVDRTGSAALAYDTQLTTTLEAFGATLSNLSHEVTRLRNDRVDYPQPAPAGSDQLTEDVATLTLEVMELRSERVQLMQLMSGLQQQLSALQWTLSDMPVPTSAATRSTLVSLADHTGSARTSNGHEPQPHGEDSVSDLRTPRRLGHQIR